MRQKSQGRIIDEWRIQDRMVLDELYEEVYVHNHPEFQEEFNNRKRIYYTTYGVKYKYSGRYK